MNVEELERALRIAKIPPNGVTADALKDLIRADDANDWDVSTTARHLQVSPHTLRYYERIGLVTVRRDALGHRRYDPGTVRRLVFLIRMRASGMSIANLCRYIEFVEAGPSSIPDRLALLQTHRDDLRRQIESLQLALATTEFKLAVYTEGPEP